MNDKSKSKNAKVDLYAAFGRDPSTGWGAVGVAWVGGACSEGPVQCTNDDTNCWYKTQNRGQEKVWLGTSFNEWSRTPSSSALVFTRYNLSSFDIHLMIIKSKSNKE